jgi:hypothetical protein
MKYTKQSMMEAARKAGSTATTFRGAWRYMLTIVPAIRFRHNFTPIRKLTELPKGVSRVVRYPERILVSGEYNTSTRMEWTPQQAYRAVESKKRFMDREDRKAREIMAAGRYIKRRKMPAVLLDRIQYLAYGEDMLVRLGLPSLPDAEAMAATLTQPFLRSAAAGLEAHWPYRRSDSRWAGGEHSVSVRLGVPSASCESRKVWSDHGKWSSSATITTDLPTLLEFPTLRTKDGLGLCKAEKIGNREYKITWIEQSLGVSLKTVEGYLIRGYHCKAISIEQARKKAATARANALGATIRSRNDKRAKRLGLASLRAVFVALEDSLAAGNCKSSSEQFASRVWQQLGASGPCAVRADVMLQIRDDNYTRRALGAAMSHHAA